MTGEVVLLEQTWQGTFLEVTANGSTGFMSVFVCEEGLGRPQCITAALNP